MKIPRLPRFVRSIALGVCAIQFLIGCVTAPPPAPTTGTLRITDNISYWDGDSLTGPPSVVINLTEQRAYLYKGGQLAGVSLISSGREGLDTVTGNYKIIQKSKDHRSSLYGEYVDANGTVIQRDVDTTKHPKPPGATYVGASMPNFMRIVRGTGMHAGFLPGYPDSHGCIRMPQFMSEAFFRTVQLGTPVQIVR